MAENTESNFLITKFGAFSTFVAFSFHFSLIKNILLLPILFVETFSNKILTFRVSSSLGKNIVCLFIVIHYLWIILIIIT